MGERLKPFSRRWEHMSLPTITRPRPAEPIELDDAMTRSDLVTVLQRLPFRRAGDRCIVQLDRGVRDFLDVRGVPIFFRHHT
jgi:hypothetical protein